MFLLPPPCRLLLLLGSSHHALSNRQNIMPSCFAFSFSFSSPSLLIFSSSFFPCACKHNRMSEGENEYPGHGVDGRTGRLVDFLDDGRIRAHITGCECPSARGGMYYAFFTGYLLPGPKQAGIFIWMKFPLVPSARHRVDNW